MVVVLVALVSSGSSVNGGAGFDASSLVGTSVGDNGWFAGGGGGSQQAGYSVPR